MPNTLYSRIISELQPTTDISQKLFAARVWDKNLVLKKNSKPKLVNSSNRRSLWLPFVSFCFLLLIIVQLVLPIGIGLGYLNFSNYSGFLYLITTLNFLLLAMMFVVSGVMVFLMAKLHR